MSDADDSGLKLLRTAPAGPQQELPAPWNTGLESLVDKEDLAEVFFSTFDGSAVHLSALLRLLARDQCPLLVSIVLCSDFAYTRDIHLHPDASCAQCPDATLPFSCSTRCAACHERGRPPSHMPYPSDERVTLLHPRVPRDWADRPAAGAHGIVHPKLVLLKHRSHLRILVASANLHSWDFLRSEDAPMERCGECLYVSPRLPSCEPDSRVLFAIGEPSFVGRRFGQTLCRLLTALIEEHTRTNQQARGAVASLTHWPVTLCSYELERIPDNVRRVPCTPDSRTNAYTRHEPRMPHVYIEGR